MNDDEWICNITPLLGPQVSYTCEQLVLHAMDYFSHCQFLPIALASELSDRCGSTWNVYGLVSLVWGWSTSMGLYRNDPGPLSNWSMSMGFCQDDPAPSSIIFWRVLPLCWINSACVVGGPNSSSRAVAYDEDDVSLGSGSMGMDWVSDRGSSSLGSKEVGGLILHSSEGVWIWDCGHDYGWEYSCRFLLYILVTGCMAWLNP